MILMCYNDVDKTIIRNYVNLGFIFPASVTCNAKFVCGLHSKFMFWNDKLLYVSLVLGQMNRINSWLAYSQV